jgi:hypothetical protein
MKGGNKWLCVFIYQWMTMNVGALTYHAGNVNYLTMMMMRAIAKIAKSKGNMPNSLTVARHSMVLWRAFFH